MTEENGNKKKSFSLGKLGTKVGNAAGEFAGKMANNVADTVGSTVSEAAGKIADNVVNKAGGVMNNASDTINNAIQNPGATAKGVAQTIGNAATATADASSKVATVVANKTVGAANATKNQVINAIDENGNGQIDIEDVIIKGLKTPGIKIDREDFLRAEFKTKYPKDVVEDLVEYNPAHAGISTQEVDKIANDVIQFERLCVSGISAALGTPGGVAVVATASADIIQYYGYMLRATQKLLYLYGFPEINMDEKGQKFDSQTINTLIMCMGVMYGVNGANKALLIVSNGLAKGVSKKIMNAALTKGVVYPVIKSIAKWFSVNMTKDMLSHIAEKSIPVVGGIIGGGVTYVTFKACCEKLQKSLQDTMLSNPDHKQTKEELETILE